MTMAEGDAMMHQEYEEWLFAYYDQQDTETPLTTGQEAQLLAHLKGCTDCRVLAESWQAVNERLRYAPTLAPKVGFARRWEARFQADRQRVQRRQTLTVLGFSAFGVITLLASLVIMLIPLIQSPKALVWAGVYRLITIFAYMELAQNVLLPFMQAATGVVPVFWWPFFAGLLTLLGVLWVVSYRVLMNPWRITR